jgi:hypothetical protein
VHFAGARAASSEQYGFTASDIPALLRRKKRTSWVLRSGRTKKNVQGGVQDYSFYGNYYYVPYTD